MIEFKHPSKGQPEKTTMDTSNLVANADQHTPPEANATGDASANADTSAHQPPEATATVGDAAKSSDGDAPSDTKDVIETYAADAEKTAQDAIVDLSNAIRSADNTSDQVDKAQTQSPSMQSGAQVAANNAKMTMLKRFAKVVEHFGETVAADIRADLAKLHNAEAVVKAAFKLGGADSAEVP